MSDSQGVEQGPIQNFESVDSAISIVSKCLERSHGAVGHDGLPLTRPQFERGRRQIDICSQFSGLHERGIQPIGQEERQIEFTKLMRSISPSRKLQRDWERRLEKKIARGEQVADEDVPNPRVNTFKRPSKRTIRKRAKAEKQMEKVLREARVPCDKGVSSNRNNTQEFSSNSRSLHSAQRSMSSTAPSPGGIHPSTKAPTGRSIQCTLQNKDFLFSDEDI
ncbi:MAG: hypothetical protein M1814_002760 [Vezdaea aestivalis]|nr:MAG: hypothetical protein M1814_002760 [Vezdaea aestivalis]